MGISQDEIVHNAQSVMKGLEALRLEHQTLLGGLKSITLDDESALMAQQEKSSMLERSLEMIDLGLGEAHVMAAISGKGSFINDVTQIYPPPSVPLKCLFYLNTYT